MVWAFLGVFLGLGLGALVSFEIPSEGARYTAVIILGILDAVFGALRAEINHDDFSSVIFLSGVLFNIVLAVFITALGDKLGLDLYLAATIVFTFRIFSNLGIIRREMMRSWIAKRHLKNIKVEAVED